MAIQVTEAWTGSSLTRGLFDGDWRATRTFHVVGVDPGNAKSEALNAVAGIGIDRGASHPDNSRMVCQNVSADENIVRPTVTATYSIIITGDSDPLRFVTRWRWERLEICEAVDRDFYGNPLTDAAGVPFDPSPTDTRGVLRVTAIRNEPFFDVRKSILYSEKTNSAAYTMPGAGRLEMGQMYCSTVMAQSDVYAGMPYVPVMYVFDIQEGEKLDGSDEYDAFFFRFLNAGRCGWAKPSSAANAEIGMIVNGRGVQVDAPTQLNGDGTPVDTSRLVQISHALEPQAAVANPNPLPDNVAKIKKTIGSQTVTYLGFRRKGFIDFNSLSL